MNQHLAKAIEIMNKNKIYDIGKVLSLVAFGLLINSLSDNTDISYCALPLVPLLMAGGGIAASLFGKKKKAPPPPKPVDIFARGKKGQPSIAEKQATGLFSQYYPTAIPLALQTSAEYGPQIMGQMFDQTGQFLGGVGGQPGFQELQRTTGLQAGQTIADLRAAELGQQTGQTGLTRGLMEALSPEQAAAVAQANQTAAQAQGLESDFMGRAGGMMGQYGSQVGQYGTTLGDISGYAGTTISDAQAQELAAGTLGGINPYVGETISGVNADVSRATQMAEEAFQRRGTLSPEEQRMAQQQAREVGAASGRLGGNSAIAAEIQNREAAKAARRGEAATLGQQAFGQQLGAAGQRLASEQALYSQRGANVERDVALQQARFGQGLGALQQRLATQQARYGQLGSEQERELARRQNLFSQDIAGGAQRAQERQLGFGQLMDIEQRRALAREEAAQAGQRSYGMAGEFYTNPGLAALRSPSLSYGAGQQDLRTALTLGPSSSGEFDYNMPLGFAQNQGAAQNQYNQDVYNTNLANQQAKSQMWQGIGSSLLSAGLGSMGGVSGSNFSSFLGSGNFGNAGTAFGNMGLEAMGRPLRAYTV